MRAATFALGLALGLTAASSFSWAGAPPDVQGLLQKCTVEGSKDWNYCIGYVGGIGTVMLLNGSLTDFGFAKPPLEMSICRTERFTATAGAMVQAFRNWAEKHPESWGAEGHIGVMNALRETWPCK
jgi:Rap1a immunity proteins